jgi:hypothetical protein
MASTTPVTERGETPISPRGPRHIVAWAVLLAIVSVGLGGAVTIAFKKLQSQQQHATGVVEIDPNAAETDPKVP